MAKELESSKNHRVLVGTMMEQSSYSGPLPKLAILRLTKKLCQVLLNE